MHSITQRILPISLNNQSYNNKEKYYLLIEAADGTVHKKIEFTIDIALDF